MRVAGTEQGIRNDNVWEVEMKKHLVLGIILFLFCSAGAGRAFAQWSPISMLKYARITGILILNDTTVFAGGFSGPFVKSTDAGVSWTQVVPNGMGTDSIFTLDNCGGYLYAGTRAPASVYLSSDNGNSWNVAGEGFPAGTNVNGMTYLDGVTYAATNFGVFGSKDHGTTWTKDSVGLILGEPGYSAAVIYGTIGITSAGGDLYTLAAVTGRGVYKTPTDNIAWKNIGLDTLSGLAITSLDSDVFVGTDKGVFMYGGNSTWLSRSKGLPFSDTTSVTSILFAQYDSLLFAYLELSSQTYYGHELYLTTDRGESWLKVDVSGLATTAISAIAANHKYLFAGTQSGAYLIPITDIVTSVDGRSPRQPATFSLSQNYPNPFNPTTVITFTVRSSGFVSLTVYDVLGAKVATLVDGRQSAGTHSVVFNGSKYASGVYFYRLTAPGVNMVRKMLLEK